MCDLMYYCCKLSNCKHYTIDNHQTCDILNCIG